MAFINTPLRNNSVSRRGFMTNAAITLGVSIAPAALGAATKHDLHLPPTPQDFGATGDGINNDSPAIDKWLRYLIQNDVSGFVPSGDYLMNTVVRVRLQKTVRFGIIGAGSAVSRFIVSPLNIEGAFDINAFNTRSHQLKLDGFSILARGAAKIGFRFIMPEGGNQHQRSLVMADVWARGANKQSDHFKTVFDFTGCWRPRIQNCGWDGPFIKVTDADSSPRYYSDVAFKLDGCYGLSVEDCYVWGCKTGISARVFVGHIHDVRPAKNGRVHITLSNGPMPFTTGFKVYIRGSKNYDGLRAVKRLGPRTFEIKAPYAGSHGGQVSIAAGPEGMNFKDNTLNRVMTGIHVQRANGREPTCWINGHHINYRNDGIVLDGIKILQMDQNNTYNVDKNSSYKGNPTDLNLRNVSEYIISGHVFHFDGHDRRTGIRVESDTRGEGDNGLIHHCIFSGKFRIGIYLSKNAEGIRVGPNLYPGTLTKRILDEGGTNLIE